MDGTPRRPLPALGAALVALIVLTGCSALEGFLAPAAMTDRDVFTIEVGDCLDDAEVGDEVVTVPIVDCTEPHDSEVFARSEVRGDAFPGADELQARLTEFCQGEAFTDFVGVPYADSDFHTGGYYPTAASWATGDRELLCTVREDGVRTTGSLEGARR